MNNGSGLIRDSVYSRIRADILTCGLAPGSRVFENDLAERYGVSKSPVRDALLRLQEHGLVEVLPRKGYLIRPISLA
ncbi:MAG: GntR family transcriptional regulator, partial [Rhodospirillales bacterium]|nr:GntR family transcriptional regulator [Rhodospirillales bacterium]